MGLLDFLRGVVPSAAQQLARYPWNTSRNPAPSWLFDPASYDWSDVAGPMPLPDYPDGPDAASAVPLIDQPSAVITADCSVDPDGSIRSSTDQ